MRKQRPPVQFGQVLDRLSAAGEDAERVSLGAMLDAVGRRSYGPLIMLPGLIALSPLSGIPGVPTTVAGMVLIIAGQLLLGRNHLWLPQWLLRRSAPRGKFDKALRFLRPIARFTDRLVRRRLARFTRDVGVRMIAFVCIAIAVGMPALELLPMASTVAGAAFTAFGLGLMAEDGLLVLVALGLCGAAGWLVVQALL